MTVVAFEPHADDVTLFCAFAAMRERARVITVLHGDVQASRRRPVTRDDRLFENELAMRELGLEWEQWDHSDARPDWYLIRRQVENLDLLDRPRIVLAPLPETGGHVDHNRVGEICADVFTDRCRFYSTYRTSGHRARAGLLVEPEPEQIVRKLRALARHRSQIEEPSTRAWFLDDQREWLADSLSAVRAA